MTSPGGNDFINTLVAQGSGASSQSFASGSNADPARQGFSKNVGTGTVNLGLQPITRLVGGEPYPGSQMNSSSVDQAALALFGMSKGANGQVAQLQQKLYAAGYLTRINTPGMPDDDTARAYGSLLQQVSASNQAGDPITVDDYLTQSAQAAAAAGVVGRGATTTNGLRLHTTAPLDIMQTAQQVAQQELGRKLSNKQLQAFVAVYHGIEANKNAQTASTDPAIQAGTNVTTEDAPTLSAAADNYVQQNFATEYGANNVANTFDAFRKLIS